MANTYNQIHIQLVFSPKYRQSLISPDWEDELYKYISGIIQNDTNKHKLLAINGMPDHIHIFFGMRPDQALSKLVQEVKASSSRWINDKGFVSRRFEWQNGFGAFSYSKRDVQNVINYIRNQKAHHQKISFLEEYTDYLREMDISFDEKYLFHQPVNE